MRTALDRLLARPSTLRALRTLIAHDGLSSVALERSFCYPSKRPPSCCPQISCRGFRTSFPVQNEERDHAASDAIHAGNEPSTSAHCANPTTSESAAVDSRELTGESWDKYVEKLQFQSRLYGRQGVRDVWAELREKDMDLPTAGPQASFLWETFLAVDELVVPVVTYAESLKDRTGRNYEPLYGAIIGRCFAQRRHPAVYQWHDRLISRFPPRPGTLRMIATKVAGGKMSIVAFRYIYFRNDQHDVHDALISTLCKKRLYNTAFRCQTWLAYANDLPSVSFRDLSSGSSVEEAFYKSALELSDQPSKKGRRSVENAPDPHDENPSMPRFSRESMNRILGEVHNVKPKQLDDHFCARIFATKAFRIDAVISGLRMFGVEEIGPLALREMASRANSLPDITQNIEKLQDAGISIGPSVYSQAIKKFADDLRPDLLDALLSTDQHPDAFEDRALQRKLLTSYVKRGQWQDVHRTLAILTMFHDDPVTSQWNILVQALSNAGNVLKLRQTLDDMLSRNVLLTGNSIRTLKKHQLRLRNPSKGHMRPLSPDDDDDDDVALVTNILRGVVISGGHVQPSQWVEIFRRYGMSNRFDEVFKLALWAAQWYSRPNVKISGPSKTWDKLVPRKSRRPQISITHFVIPPTDPRHPLRQLFTPIQLRVFVAWGLYSAFRVPVTGEKPSHWWTRGIQLCRMLRHHGICVKTNMVRSELRRQLAQVFRDPENPSRRMRNRRIAKNNPYSLIEMIDHANWAWGEVSGKPLLDPMELTNKSPLHHNWWVKMIGRNRLVHELRLLHARSGAQEIQQTRAAKASGPEGSPDHTLGGGLAQGHDDVNSENPATERSDQNLSTSSSDSGQKSSYVQKNKGSHVEMPQLD